MRDCISAIVDEADLRVGDGESFDASVGGMMAA
jgi:hypothetical protein